MTSALPARAAKPFSCDGEVCLIEATASWIDRDQSDRLTSSLDSSGFEWMEDDVQAQDVLIKNLITVTRQINQLVK